MVALGLFTCSADSWAQPEGGAAPSCRTVAVDVSQRTPAALLTRASFAGPLRDAIARAGLAKVEPGQGPDMTIVFDAAYSPSPRDENNQAHASISVAVRLVRRLLPDVEFVRCAPCASDLSYAGPPAEEGLWDAAVNKLFHADRELGRLDRELASRSAGVRLASPLPAELRMDAPGQENTWQPLPDDGLVLRCMKAGDIVTGTVRHASETRAFSLAAPAEHTFAWAKPEPPPVPEGGRAAVEPAGGENGGGGGGGSKVDSLGVVAGVGLAGFLFAIGLVAMTRNRTIHMVFIGSSPQEGFTPLMVSTEQTALVILFGGRVVVDALLNATFDDVLRLRSRRAPTMVHFAGHGVGQKLVLQDGTGEARPVDAAFVQRYLDTSRATRLVFLNACDTQPIASAVTRRGRIAVGWSGEVKDEAAAQFAGTLYASINAGQSVRDAFDLAKLGYDAAAVVPGIGRDPATAVPHLCEAETGDAARCVLLRRIGG